MIRNIFLVTIRNILKDKLFSIINLFGLVMGITAFLFIAIFIVDELSYDTFHKDADQIYRIGLRRTFPGGEMSYATTPFPLGETMYRDVPEVESFTRVSNNIGEWKVKNENEDKEFFEQDILVADSNFFDFFSFTEKIGNLKGSLDNPRSVVLTEESASRYFGNNDPVGKHLIMQDTMQFVVTAVIANPVQSHLHFQFLISSETFPESSNNWQWVSYSIHNYIKLKNELSRDEVEKKFPLIVKAYVAPVVEAILGKPYEEYELSGNMHFYYLQPVKDIHLKSNLQREIQPNSSLDLVIILGVVAIAIILLVGINYINLTTSKSIKRAKEVGIRKIYGSSKGTLSMQFLMEALFFTVISVFVSLVIVGVLMPHFAQLVQRPMSLAYLLDWRIILIIVLSTIFISFLSGIYPAFFVASFQPIAILKGEVTKGKNRNILRNTLVVLQFVVSILMIIGTLTIVKQVDFMMTKDIGFDKDQVLVLERVDRVGGSAYTLKTQLQKLPGVGAVSSGFFMPGRNIGSGTFEAIGMPSTERHLGAIISMEFDLITALGIDLIAGRALSPDIKSDTNAVMVNQSLVSQIGWKNPIGEKVKLTSGQPFEIVGVLNDFHLNSMREKIEPTIVFGYEIEPSGGQNNAPPFYFIKIERGQNIREVTTAISQTWNNILPDQEMYSFFFDSEFNQQYHAEERFTKIFSIFSILAVVIALIGVIGLSIFTVGQRMKEISIRKVLGANMLTIISLLTKNYLLLVFMANLLALPAGMYFISEWLNKYPYRVSLPLGVFVITMILTLTLVVLVTLIQSIKASLTNPINSLRNE